MGSDKKRRHAIRYNEAEVEALIRLIPLHNSNADAILREPPFDTGRYTKRQLYDKIRSLERDGRIKQYLKQQQQGGAVARIPTRSNPNAPSPTPINGPRGLSPAPLQNSHLPSPQQILQQHQQQQLQPHLQQQHLPPRRIQRPPQHSDSEDDSDDDMMDDSSYDDDESSDELRIHEDIPIQKEEHNDSITSTTSTTSNINNINNNNNNNRKQLVVHGESNTSSTSTSGSSSPVSSPMKQDETPNSTTMSRTARNIYPPKLNKSPQIVGRTNQTTPKQQIMGVPYRQPSGGVIPPNKSPNNNNNNNNSILNNNIHSSSSSQSTNSTTTTPILGPMMSPNNLNGKKSNPSTPTSTSSLLHSTPTSGLMSPYTFPFSGGNFFQSSLFRQNMQTPSTPTSTQPPGMSAFFKLETPKFLIIFMPTHASEKIKTQIEQGNITVNISGNNPWSWLKETRNLDIIKEETTRQVYFPHPGKPYGTPYRIQDMDQVGVGFIFENASEELTVSLNDII